MLFSDPVHAVRIIPSRVDSNMRTTQVVFLLAIFLLVSSVSIAQVGKAPNRINLHQGWTLQSSAKIEANGEAISKAKFPVKGWYKTSVPMTVLAAQVETG